MSAHADNVLNRMGPAILAVVLVSVTLLQLYSGAKADSFFLIASIVSILGSTILATLQIFNTMTINYRPFLILALNHLILGLFTLAIVQPDDPLFYIWLVIIFRSDYSYGRKGAIFSVLFSISVAAGNLLLSSVASDTSEWIHLAEKIIILSAVTLLITSIREITDKERKVLMVSMDRAQLERQRLLSLINSMADSVIATDESGTIKLYNGATLEILDTNEDLEGQKIQRFLNLYDPSGVAVDIVKSATKKNSNLRRTDLSLKFSDQEKVNLYISISPIKLGFRSNSERGFIMILRDITKEKSLEEERDEFISVVSHELRTPITISEAEISNAELINDRELKNEIIEKALKSAHKQVVFLSNMINDLATLSRAQHDDLDMELSIIDPSVLLDELTKNYSAEANQKGLTFDTNLIGTVQTVVSSKLYVEEILQNFVTNSLKYTKSGGLTVTAEQDSLGILFKVRDTGIGISKTDQKKLFEKFFRSEDFRTRESSGTGLGLYVTLKLAKKIGAKITVESEINKGSSFNLLVPSKQKQQKHHSVEDQMNKLDDNAKPQANPTEQ